MATSTAVESHHNRSVGLYFLFWTAASCMILVLPVVISSLVSDSTWSVITAIATFWFGAAVALFLFEKLRMSRTTAEYSLRFPGFCGARFPIFYLLRYEDSIGAIVFSDPDLVYSLGEANESIFFLQNKRPDDVERCH